MTTNEQLAFENEKLNYRLNSIKLTLPKEKIISGDNENFENIT